MASEFDLSVRFKVLMGGVEASLKKISVGFKNLIKPVSDANKEFIETNRRLKDVGDRVKNVGSSLSLKLSAPLAALGALSTKAAIDFESSFTGVRKTVTATDEEFDKIRKSLRKMATDEVPLSVKELDGIAEAAGQLGVETKNITSFTKVMADLGVTTNLTAQEAATQLARFANITGLAQTDFEKLGSVIVDLGNNFATTEAEIVAISKRLAGAGKLVGLTEPQILALGTALSSLGVEAEAGGTAFSQVMRKIDKETGTGSKKMRGFAFVAGKSVAEFEKAWKEDAATAMIEFVGGLDRLKTEGKNVSVILDALGFEGIRISDSLLRASGSGDLLTRAMERGNKAWEENTALAKEAALRYGTAASRLIMFKNQIVVAAASLGEVLVPILLKVVGVIKILLKWFTDLSPTTKLFIAVMGTLVAAIGPLLVIVGGLIVAFASLAIFSSVVGVGMLPLIGIIAGVMAAVTVLVAGAVWLINNWRSVIKFFQDFGSIILLIIGVVGLAIGSILIPIVAALAFGAKFLMDNWEPVSKFFIDLWDGILSGFNAAIDLIKKGINFLPDRIKSLIGIDVGGNVAATGAATGGDSLSQTEVSIKVSSDDGSTATVEKVTPKAGDAKVNVATVGYVGAYAQ